MRDLPTPRATSRVTRHLEVCPAGRRPLQGDSRPFSDMTAMTMTTSRLTIFLAIAIAACSGEPRTPAASRVLDTGFAAVQHRGQLVMGVDQYASTHRFDKTADGGRIELQNNEGDSAAVAIIRAHMRDIAQRFANGDFSPSRSVHAQDVPGADEMAARGHLISYTPRDLPRGAELRIQSADQEAVAAVHRFMDFQRSDHRAGGADPVHRH